MKITKIEKNENGVPYIINVINDSNDIYIKIKWDGCININKFSNGKTPITATDDDRDYIHICEVKSFIKDLQNVVAIAKDNFSKVDFENNWEEFNQ